MVAGSMFWLITLEKCILNMARLGRDDLELTWNLIPYATKTIPGTGHDTFKYHKSTFKIIKLPHAIDAF